LSAALAERYRALGCGVRGMDLKSDARNNVVAGNLTSPSRWSDHAKCRDLFVNSAAVAQRLTN